jgi:hypothetical protein
MLVRGHHREYPDRVARDSRREIRLCESPNAAEGAERDSGDRRKFPDKDLIAMLFATVGLF